MFVKTDALKPVRTAVVGAGYFGRIHALKYAELAGVELVGVIDPNADAAGRVADELGTQSFRSFDDVLGDVDAVSIAAPACAHYELAKRALESGVHTLVEKPIALSLRHADELTRLARRKGLRLQVGHQERFVIGQFGLLSQSETPFYVECRRAGPFTGRAMDVSVVMDLMIHDLDLMHQVIPSEVTGVEADAEFVHGRLADEVTADVSFACGGKVRLFASRNAPEKERSMRLIYRGGEVNIDFVNRTLTNTTGMELTPAFGGDIGGVPAIANDPLGYGIGRFVHSVRSGEEPTVTGEHARQALASALMITDAYDAAATSGQAMIA